MNLQDLSATKHLHNVSGCTGLILHITIHQKCSELTILYICNWNTQARHGAHEKASKHIHQLAECRKSKLYHKGVTSRFIIIIIIIDIIIIISLIKLTLLM